MFMEDLFNQYRERHDIPSPAELKGLRKKYGLSAHTKDYVKVRDAVISYVEPQEYSLRRDFYSQFEEIVPLSYHSVA